MPAWPSTLPGFCVENYALDPAAATARTDMESGPARQRQRFTQTPTGVPVMAEFTLDELATFQAWFFYTLHQGADWFDCRLLAGIGVVTTSARFKIDNNGKPYAAKPQGNGQVWQVRAELEVNALPMLTPAQLATRL
jgi:hypothetical protein